MQESRRKKAEEDGQRQEECIEASTSSTAVSSSTTSCNDEQPILFRSNIVDELFLKQKELTMKEDELQQSFLDLKSEKSTLEEKRRDLKREKEIFQREVDIIRKFEKLDFGKVSLNVGGNIFITSIEILKKSLFLRALFLNWNETGFGMQRGGVICLSTVVGKKHTEGLFHHGHQLTERRKKYNVLPMTNFFKNK